MPALPRFLTVAALLLSAPIAAEADRLPAPATVASAPAKPANLQPGGRWLSRLAPAADPKVLELAVSAMQCAQASGVGTDARRLAVIDYSRPSLLPRLWVFDLAAGRLLYEEVVAHGQGSGDNMATRFSNLDGSHQSSLGLFVTADTYTGKNGYSLRMRGLEPGVNDAAMARAIVMHGAPYVDPAQAQRMGRLGRSWGCPAVRSAVARPMIDLLKDGQFVFSYYPDQAWLARSALLNCPAARGTLAHATQGRGPTSG
ncbi:murein L,D-transpeptidase catalytic domain family protein [Lysobacter auxotrophicus]|uniref:Murein L,D-transpeptidase catalytic domain family protein n=1 Tax=Lysobacter auxotrophicus TaxID=2992573 RepID=A0ABM8DBL8_9GAMM|nr:murein L,D-transpeptidase catalytic domain family protein [Lysobacter auxotrophicus]BDU15913.1 murein L,D-transpeptidase catalytic domain family protein [Lysobacter auxotrophicus]